MTQRFIYRARDSAGSERIGSVDALDQRAAIQALLRQGLTPIEAHAEQALMAGTPSLPMARGKVRATDRQFFFTELGTLLASGISLSEALASMTRAYARLPLGPAIATISADVNAGRGLSEAIAVRLLGVPPYAIAMVRAGEASGQLAEAFGAVAAQLDYDRRVAQAFRQALTYPAVLMVAGMLAMALIFVGVLPRFAGLLQSGTAEMPAFSRWVIESGVWASRHGLEVGLAAGAVVLAGVALLRSPENRDRLRELSALLPVIGAWLRRTDVARWLTVLAALLRNRIPVVQAIELSAAALDSKSLRQSVAAIGAELRSGGSLSDCLAGRGWFPETRVNLVWVGERSGQLPAMLEKLGDLETDQAQQDQKRLLAIIEPAAILSIGAAIGLVMVAVMMAITGMNSSVG